MNTQILTIRTTLELATREFYKGVTETVTMVQTKIKVNRGAAADFVEEAL
jgi:hypothetical protein